MMDAQAINYPMLRETQPLRIPNLREDLDLMRQEVGKRLEMVNKNARRYRRQNSFLLVVALLFGLTAAGLAGDSAFGGKMVAASVAEASTGKTPSDLPKGWRNVCGLIAVLTLLGTAATGVNNALKINEHQARSFVCAGAMDGLQAELLPGSSMRRETLNRVKTELAKLLKDYPECFR